MIDGLKFRMTSDELHGYLNARVIHHHERQHFYEKQLAVFEAGTKGEAMPQFTNGDPKQGMRAKIAEHENKVKLFTFMRDHLVVNETYDLSEQDLIKIEILSHGRW